MKNIFAFILVIMINCGLYGQEPTINNFVHPESYQGVLIGKLGNVVKYGNGNKKLIIVIGMGFSQSVLHNFMMRNKNEYEMYVFTTAGRGGTIAPKMPNSNDFALRPWSNGYENAVIKYITENKLGNELSIIGFFSGGVQYATHIVNKRPELFNKLILVAGELNRNFGVPVSLKQRKQIVNEQMGPFFKTVQPKVWYNGLYKPSLFSKDSIRAQRYWEHTTQPTLPTEIRYLQEFNADDIEPILKEINIKTIIFTIGFEIEYVNYERDIRRFNYNWVDFIQSNNLEHISIKEFKDSRLMIFDSKPKLFDSVLKDFIKIKN